MPSHCQLVRWHKMRAGCHGELSKTCSGGRAALGCGTEWWARRGFAVQQPGRISCNVAAWMLTLHRSVQVSQVIGCIDFNWVWTTGVIAEWDMLVRDVWRAPVFWFVLTFLSDWIYFDLFLDHQTLKYPERRFLDFCRWPTQFSWQQTFVRQHPMI